MTNPYDAYYDERYEINFPKAKAIASTEICSDHMWEYLAHLQTQIDILTYRIAKVDNGK